jgi:transcription initiation factor TFIIH subunit 4
MQEDPDYIVGSNRSSRDAVVPLVITSKGYEFMLRDINAQVWQFVLQYMNSLSSLHESARDAIRIEVLSFLICLGSTRVGDGYHISVLGKSKEARQVMKDFGRFGLVFVCRVAGKLAFYPTRVAVNLIASNEKGISGLFESEQSVAVTRSLEEALAAPIPSRLHLAVVVQTNFQVVAYTRSKLHISTIGLFCDVQSYRRLPNVIFFHLSRDSVRGAFRLGITADQILRFLHVHAHPMLRLEGRALVPSNVRDQIMLWDRERRRVVMDEVRLVLCVFGLLFQAQYYPSLTQ